jgi:hypothetical protein
VGISVGISCTSICRIVARSWRRGGLPRCELCDMFIPTKTLAGGHRSTLCCRRGQDLKRKRAAQMESRKADEVVFTVRGIPLDLVRDFLYLGRKLSSSDDDWLDVIKNLLKARQRWARISRVLTREGATPRVSAMFFKAVIQTVLLYGSETWVLTPRMLSKLEGCHQQIARRLMGRAPVYLRREGQWQYSPIGDAMEEAGLFSIEEYITRHRNRIAVFVATRPLIAVCKEMESLGISGNHQFWWNQ